MLNFCNMLKIVRTLTNVTSSLYCFVHSHSQGAYLLSDGTTALHLICPKFLNIHNVCGCRNEILCKPTFTTASIFFIQTHFFCVDALTTPNATSKWCSQIKWRTIPAASILALCCSKMFTISVWPCRAAAVRAVSPNCNAFPKHNSKASAKYGSH